MADATAAVEVDVTANQPGLAGAHAACPALPHPRDAQRDESEQARKKPRSSFRAGNKE